MDEALEASVVSCDGDPEFFLDIGESTERVSFQGHRCLPINNAAVHSSTASPRATIFLTSSSVASATDGGAFGFGLPMGQVSTGGAPVPASPLLAWPRPEPQTDCYRPLRAVPRDWYDPPTL